VSGTEWLLVVLVILVPLALAVIVTKWTLDQALKRQRRNREPRPEGERVPTPLATAAPGDVVPVTPDEPRSSSDPVSSS
jgi:hypothetical protein